MNHVPAIFLATLLAVPALAQDVGSLPPPGEEPEETRVAILGYHQFSQTADETEMLIRTSKHLLAIRDIPGSGGDEPASPDPEPDAVAEAAPTPLPARSPQASAVGPACPEPRPLPSISPPAE